MGGEPCIRGMRITVRTIIGLLASGRSLADIMAAYPYLEEEDVRESLAYIGIDRRFDEIKNGHVKAVSSEEVFERLRRKSEERRGDHGPMSDGAKTPHKT
jgi:uncharacterized protein (DUF433 family)